MFAPLQPNYCSLRRRQMPTSVARLGRYGRLGASRAGSGGEGLAPQAASAGGWLQAVILVGGEGTRLRPLTYGTPKPMVPLFGVPFLERTLSRLHQDGIDDVILAAGYLPKAITDHLGDGSRLRGMPLTSRIGGETL